MDRATLWAQLEQARARVIEGEQRIASQKNLIHHLNRDGPSGLNAEQYLRFLEGLQAMQVAHRDRLEKGLVTAIPAFVRP